jgi:DNA-binding response OmpR family regulator
MAKRRILTIGHDWRIRILIRANLEALGLEVHGAVNGHHNLQSLGEDKPDLILLETDLLDIEFTPLLDHLQAQLGGQVPIIVISAELPSRKLRTNGHAVSYLLKPFAIPALLQKVEQALSNIPGDREPTADGG